MKKEALIFSIEEFSAFDGPGIRSTVFFKGCPLKCRWCHNPESQSFSAEILRKPTANEKCGELYSVDDLCKKLLKNASIYALNGGGITFSGGEPLSFTPFLVECMQKLKGKIHLAVQTSGYGKAEDFDKILALSDYILFDLKIMDENAFRKWCGGEAEIVKQNYRALTESKVEFITRVPLIPSVTDTSKNLIAIAEFMAKNGAKAVECLPYNRLAGAKYGYLNREYSPGFDEAVAVNPRVEIFEKYGLEYKIL